MSTNANTPSSQTGNEPSLVGSFDVTGSVGDESVSGPAAERGALLLGVDFAFTRSTGLLLTPEPPSVTDVERALALVCEPGAPRPFLLAAGLKSIDFGLGVIPDVALVRGIRAGRWPAVEGLPELVGAGCGSEGVVATPVAKELLVGATFVAPGEPAAGVELAAGVEPVAGVELAAGGAVAAVTWAGVEAVTWAGVEAVTWAGVEPVTWAGVEPVTEAGVEPVTVCAHVLAPPRW